MTPPKKKPAAPPEPVAEAWEEYSEGPDPKADLLAQPWEPENFRESGPASMNFSLKDLEGGGFEVTEGRKKLVVRAGQTPAQAIKEAEDGDTFTRTVYSEGGTSEGYLTDQERLDAMRQSVRLYREDPIYRAVIDGFVFFVIGQGFQFKALDENPAVQAHLEAFWRENQMDGKDAEIVRRYLKFGEVVVRYFKNGPNGVPAKTPRLRLIPFWRVNDFKWDPEDPETLDKASLTVPAATAMSGVATSVPADELQLLLNSENEAARGEPPFMVLMRACKWYFDFVVNRVVLNRYRSAFVLFKKVKGSANRVNNADSGTSDATKKGLGGRMEKRLPKPGSVMTHNDNVEYEWKNPNTGAGDASQDAATLRQYIAAAGMVPEFLLGDAGASNLENALQAGTPFVRKVEYFQDLFAAFFQEMFKRVIEQGIATRAIPVMSTETVVQESGPVMRRVRRVLSALGLQEADEDGNLKSVRRIPTKTDVSIEWPSMIAKDRYKEAQTMALHQQMGLVSMETLRGKAGYDNALEMQRLEAEGEVAQDAFDQERDDELKAQDNQDEEDQKKAASKSAVQEK